MCIWPIKQIFKIYHMATNSFIPYLVHVALGFLHPSTDFYIYPY